MLSTRDAVNPTTIIRSSKLRDDLGLDLLVASETFQHTGSFKFRAAYNLAANVPNDEIIGVSSGNFGQALAYACKLLGKKCTVIMPHNSAGVKVEAVRSFGAETDLIDTRQISRVDRLAEISGLRPDAYLASAFDDELVIDGNSTLGDELADLDLDAVIVPVGGGGLVSGIIRSFARHGVKAEVYAAEPQIANDASRSFHSGEHVSNDTEPQSIADGARTLSLGELNWPIIRDGITDIFEVSEEAIAEAVRKYYFLANLKVEPTAALPLAALYANKERFAGKRVCCVATGGNVDPATYAAMISA